MRLHSQKSGAVLIPLFIALMVAAGCRSKIKTKTSSGGPDPAKDSPILCLDGSPASEDGTCASPETPVNPPAVTKTPVEDPDALKLVGEKIYFQTRDIISITVNKDMVAGGNTLTITNSENADGSGKMNVLVDATPVNAFGLSLDGSFRLVDAGDDLKWYFYPGENAWKGKFFYGKNYIKVYVDHDRQPVYSITELTLRDFEIFGTAITSFGGEFKNQQVATQGGPAGFQFQGWVNVLSPPSVSANGTTLTHGIFNIVNPK